MMTFTVTRNVCLLTLLFVAKGDETIDFYISQMQCQNGKGTLRLVCRVHYTNVIKIFKNGIEVSQCQTFPVPPYKYCEHSLMQDGIAQSDIHNVSMIYTIKTAKTEDLSGKWICQNGGPNDPSSSIKVQGINCHLGVLKSHSLSDEQSNFATEQVLRVVISLSLVVLPLFASYITTIYQCQSVFKGDLQSENSDEEEKWYTKKMMLQYCSNFTEQEKEPSTAGNSQCQHSRQNCSKKLFLLNNCTCCLTPETTIEEGLQILVCCIMGIIYVVIAIIIVFDKIEKDITTVLFVISSLTVNLALTLLYPLWISKNYQCDIVLKKKTDIPIDHSETAENESSNSSDTPEGQSQTVQKKTTDLPSEHSETAENKSSSSSNTLEGQSQIVLKETTDLQREHSETAENESPSSSNTLEGQSQVVLKKTSDLLSGDSETAENESPNSSYTREGQSQIVLRETTDLQREHSETAEIESPSSSNTLEGQSQIVTKKTTDLPSDHSETAEHESPNSINTLEGPDHTREDEQAGLLDDKSATKEMETHNRSNPNEGYKITLCSIMVIMYIAIAIIVSVKNMKIDLRTGLSVVCLLEGIMVFSFVSVIMTSK